MTQPYATICKQFTFEAAHTLPYHRGKCANDHGHSYVVQVCYAGPVQGVREDNSSSGMVIDFSDLTRVWKQIEHNYDHCNLNTWLPYPTAELIAEDIFKKFDRMLSHETAKLISVRLHETATSYVEITAVDNDLPVNR